MAVPAEPVKPLMNSVRVGCWFLEYWKKKKKRKMKNDKDICDRREKVVDSGKVERHKKYHDRKRRGKSGWEFSRATNLSSHHKVQYTQTGDYPQRVRHKHHTQLPSLVP